MCLAFIVQINTITCKIIIIPILFEGENPFQERKGHVHVFIFFLSSSLELRCVVGVIRHGDRTPKQKMKMIVTHLRFIALFRELKGFEKGQIKIKKPKLLQVSLFT